MTQTSYPITGVNLTHALWRSIYRGFFIGGIVDDTANSPGAGNALALTLPASGDNATVGPGKWAVNGFVCEVTGPETLYLAPVQSGQPAVTYTIGFMYDPAKEGSQVTTGGSQDGPMHLEVHDNSAVTTPPGGSWWSVYRVTRSAGVTLANSAGTVFDRRHWIGPQYLGPGNGTDRVNANSNAPRGSTAIQDGLTWSRDLNAAGVLDWVNLDDPPWVTSLTYASAVARPYTVTDITTGQVRSTRPLGARVRRGALDLAGTFQPPVGTTYFSETPTTILVLPVGMRPVFDQLNRPLAGNFTSAEGVGGACAVLRSGEVQVWAAAGKKKWLSLDNQTGIPLT